MNYQNELNSYALDLGLNLSARQFEQLESFTDHLIAYNQNVNLVGTSDKEVLLRRHVLDSLTVLKAISTLAPGAECYIDIGSGGGLPGMIVALSSDMEVCLIDSVAKKCHFLEEAAGRLGISNRVHVHVGRAEELAREKSFRGKFDVGTARAVSSLKISAELVTPFLKKGGLFLAQKTRKREADELLEAGNILDSLSVKLRQRLEFSKFKSIEENIILAYEKIDETVARYPRSWKMILESKT